MGSLGMFRVFAVLNFFFLLIVSAVIMTGAKWRNIFRQCRNTLGGGVDEIRILVLSCIPHTTFA